MKINIHFGSKPGVRHYCLLTILAANCFLFTFVRHIITGKTNYYFLNWNLFLAVIPWLISLIISSGFVKNKLLNVILLIIWFLFFPNAPYIITDLYYLNEHPEKMFWYDLIMILLFSWTGLLLGFFSLEHIEEILKQRVTKVKSVIIICCFLFICAFGVYLGRDLHWNSWDIFMKPKELFLDVVDRLIKPLEHERTWSFTILMGLFLNFIYWPMKIIKKNY